MKREKLIKPIFNKNNKGKLLNPKLGSHLPSLKNLKSTNKINKKYLNKKAQISYSQILILIISVFAFCYIINPNLVSAQTEDYACCEKTIDAEPCKFTLESECDSDFSSAPTSCNEVSFCELGCCVNSIGKCVSRTFEKDCLTNWYDNAECNIDVCELGCCILGNQAKWTNQENCQATSSFLGFPMDFREEINSEVECIFLTETDDEGACLYESENEEKCIYTTRNDCLLRTGSEINFYNNVFCSDSELNISCDAHSYTGCVEGKQEVYWFDSCGNKEEVKEECSIFLGTICGLDSTNAKEYICKSIDCEVEIHNEKIIKRNGESWCEYEGCIGDGKDVVGSRHIRHMCFMGEEKIEPCSDYRNQICVGTNTDLADESVFSEGFCRTNRWRSCYEYNNLESEIAEECEKNPDCVIKGVHIDEFSFDVCVPNYPPGFDFKNPDASRNGELECSFASQKCPVIYVKRISGWRCEINCGCENADFTQQMNDLCISLGDCGGYVNWVGKTSDDGYSSGGGRINLEQYVSCSEPQPNQEPAEPGDFGFSQILGIPYDLGEGDAPEADSGSSWLGAGMSGIGVMKGTAIGSSAAAASGIFSITDFAGTSGDSLENMVSLWETYLEGGDLGYKGAELGLSPDLDYGAIESSFESGGLEQGEGLKLPEGFGDALAGVGAALSVASFLQTGFGLDATTSYIIGGFIGYLAIYVWSWNPLVFIGLSIFQYILDLGDTKTKWIEFKCMPWQPLAGGTDCKSCNENEVICSEYKCNSLGQTCEFINKGTGNEKCVDNNPYDISSPKISPLLNYISEGYDYQNIQINGFELKKENGDCISEFTPIGFGIETDKPAQCKISENPLETYEQMQDYISGTNLYLINHTTIISIPSPAAFKNQYNLTDEEIAELGEINYYVKCKSINGIMNEAGYSIRTCVKPGPDLTAPRITKTNPKIGYVKYGKTELDLHIWVNEPSDCKWNFEDKDYNKMENLLNCKQNIEDYSLYGWQCNTTITKITNNSVYIRCKDQPWETDDSLRNIMQESYVYDLKLSDSPLQIIDFRPKDKEEIISGVEPVEVDLKLKTSGGVENGKAICRWEGNEIYSDYFTETDSNVHNYKITSATRGNYYMKFICEDVAGNIAEQEMSFRIKIDDDGPRIVRVYYDNGLKIITNENSECRYDFNKNFVWENSTIMSGQETEHVVDWSLRIYHIQCKDDYENKGGKIQVKAYNLV